MDNQLVATHNEMQEIFPAFDEVLLFALERRYLDFTDVTRLDLSTNDAAGAFDYRSDLSVIKIDEVSYDGKVDDGLHLQNMQNVIASIKDDRSSHNIISVIKSTKEKTSLYYGMSKRIDIEGGFDTHSMSNILTKALHGNFLGAKTTPMDATYIKSEIIDPIAKYSEICGFPGIPSLRIKDREAPFVQGVDRLIEGMRGEEYCLVTIAEPIPLSVIDDMIKNLFDLGSAIHSEVKSQIQKMTGTSNTVNVGLFGMSGSNTATTESENYSNSNSETRLGTGGGLSAAGTAIGGAIGAVFGGVGAIPGAAIGGAIGTIASWLTGSPLSTTATETFARGIANTVGRMTGMGMQGGYARGWNKSRAATREMLNKTAEYCEKLCDAYIERLQAGKNLGLWNVGIYLMTNDKYTRVRAQGMLRASLSGDATYWEPMRTVQINNEAIAKYIKNFNNPKYDLFLYGDQKKGGQVEEVVSFAQKVREYVSRMGIPFPKISETLQKNDEDAVKMLNEIRKCPGNYSNEDLEKAWEAVKDKHLGHPFGDIMGGVSTPLNTEELSIIMNVPRQEVQGITIREAAPFGVNYVFSGSKEDIRIGRVVHKREPLNELPYVVPRELFKKHAFVCGVTGSGKTNTCMSLLKNIDLPFLVIEPAKTEYRQMMNFIPDLRVYTLGRETVAPFRINPFEFEPGSELLTHIDSIKAVFNAAFPMYASMPYILEEAIIDIYRDKGWDLASSTDRYLDDLHSEERYDYLPTLQDLYNKIPVMVEQKKYAQEQTMNIQAALMARLSSLLTGSKGLMLNTRRSTPMKELLESKVVLELKNIGDDDEKCFLMGLFLSSIYQYREQNGGIGSDLKHVLLIEEAHRLLRHTPEFVSPEIGNSRGKAVETFTNVISEIREYGQGVVIVDQIPSKLTPDVVKNTNIKLIHRTLAKDDREYVGSTMNLTEEQDRELCLLEVGRAVIHREGMDKAFLVQVDPIKEGLKHITDDEIKENMKHHTNHKSDVYGVDKVDGLAEVYSKEDFRRSSPNLLKCVAAGLLIILADDNIVLTEIKKVFADDLKRDLGIEDELRTMAHAINYAERLFEKLNARYPGHIREMLSAKKIFIDAWFGEDVDRNELRQAVAKMLHTSEDKPPYAGVLAWYVREKDFNYTEYEEILRLAKSDDSAQQRLSDLIAKVQTYILRNVVLSAPNNAVFRQTLYDEIYSMKTGEGR